MTIPLLVFCGIATLLILLLVWAVRPPKRTHLSIDTVFEALGEKRHYARLPQILQSLREEDTDFLYARGLARLGDRIRNERKQIALRYLDNLEEEYQLLLEASRILARIAPEVSPANEFQQFRSNIRFVLLCRYLRWRLRLGLQPWDIFGILSDMEGEITLRLELATTRVGERAAIASEFPLFLENRRSGTE